MRLCHAVSVTMAATAALFLAACDEREDEESAAGTPEAVASDTAESSEPLPTITLEAQTPEPLGDGFDADECTLLLSVFEGFDVAFEAVAPEEIFIIAQAAIRDGDMSGVNEAGVELNTAGAAWRDRLDEAAELVTDIDAADALSGLAEYYEDYQSVIAQLMASATSAEQLAEDATAVSLASEALHSEAQFDAQVLEYFVEVSCQVEIDVYTAPGISTGS